MLLAEGLRHAFGRVVALDEVSFRLVPGQTLAIFGPNGAGKTTLLKVLAGLIPPPGGWAPGARRARAVGWVGPPSPPSCPPTVRANLPVLAPPCGPPWPMAELLLGAGVVARKGLVLEFRTRTAVLSAAVFTALVLTVFNFGRDPTAVPALLLAPSILWVTFTFAGMLGLNRAFQLELENAALEGLLVSPLSRVSLYWGKLLANLVFVAVVEAVGLPLFVLFFDVPLGRVLLPLLRLPPPAPAGFLHLASPFP